MLAESLVTAMIWSLSSRTTSWSPLSTSSRSSLLKHQSTHKTWTLHAAQTSPR